MKTNAQIIERGNGFPESGDHVAGHDGELYLIENLNGRIHTDGPTGANYVHAPVTLADWDDVDDDWESVGQAFVDEN